ncbi:MAG: sensor histidine kinase [Bacteroidetes bacterium]|nr:sensor histidine kinase [Fibrella sp.]
MSGNRFFEFIQQRYKRYPLAFHVPGWLLYVVLPFLIISPSHFFSQYTLLKLFGIKVINEALTITFFYVNYHILTPDALKRGRFFRLALAVPGMGALLVATNALYYRFVIRDELTQSLTGVVSGQLSLLSADQWFGTPIPLIITSLVSLLLLSSVSTGLAVFRDRNQREARHQQMIIEKKEAELSALKLQISPHFLFNTLNNMRWLARQKSDQTEEAIQRLSDMLRYMLYQANRGPVALAQEVEYLTDYIALQQLRLAPHNRVVFVTDIDNDRVLIEPLLLIHFVENAFKHGLHHEWESVVTIQLRMAQGTLAVTTSNPLFVNESSIPSANSGIGVQNVKRRLALHYPGRHRLSITQRNGLFCVDLHIDLTTVAHEVADYPY